MWRSSRAQICLSKIRDSNPHHLKVITKTRLLGKRYYYVSFRNQKITKGYVYYLF